MKNVLAFILISFLYTTVTLAHTNEPVKKKMISGKVLDKETGEALAGVKISIKGTDTFCYTDFNGHYLLSVTQGDSKEISIESTGYSPLTLKTTEVGIEEEVLLSQR